MRRCRGVRLEAPRLTAVLTAVSALGPTHIEKTRPASGPGQSHRVKAEILGNLARVYRAQGRLAEAEEAQARASLLWASQ